MITCPNCGAEIEEDVTRCPNCGYINMAGAEKKHKHDIDEIKDNIKEMDKEPAKALTKGVAKGIKLVLTTVLALIIVAAAMAAIISYELKDKPKIYTSPEEEAKAAAYKAIAAEQLAEAYDNQDIEQLAQIYDKAYSQDRVNIWGVPYYETGYAASCYMRLKQCLPNLDKKKISSNEAEEITYYCFYFYYRAYGDEGAVIFDSIRDEEIMPIITERLGYTVEDMENFRGKVLNSPNVVRSNVFWTTRKYFKNYH